MEDAIIGADEVEKSRRGRVATFDPDLLEILEQVEFGQAARLAGFFGEVEKSDRARVSAEIRKHWEKVHTTKPRIDFSPEGVPQVHHRAS